MPECFRSVLERLDKENELLHIRKPIDVRYISPLIVQAEKPVWFHDPIGFAHSGGERTVLETRSTGPFFGLAGE